MAPKIRRPYVKKCKKEVAPNISETADYSSDIYVPRVKSSATSYNKMARNLIIVESPSKCKKIEEYLGENYACISSKGHIRIIENLKAITPDGIKFVFDPEKESHVAEMSKIIARFDKTAIYIATDGDREGEAIGWHICDVFDLPVETTPRIVFHEITKPAILAAMRQPSTINMNLVKAQQARQILDMFVGFHISPVLWRYLYYNKENALSAGRCQTPALRLIMENDEKRRTNTSNMLAYKVRGWFLNREFVLDKEFDVSDEKGVIGFLSESITYNHLLSIGSPKTSVRNPPKPFNTSRLLQVASNSLGLSPKDTMARCQQLYQDGYITYMRTDSNGYSDIFIRDANAYIRERYGGNFVASDCECLLSAEGSKAQSVEAQSAEAQSAEAHEAIRPTNISLDHIENHTAASLYRLIWKNTVESLMPPAQYKTVSLKITAPENSHYISSIEIPLFQGWQKVDSKNDSSAETETAFYMQVSSHKPNTVLSYNYIITEVVQRGHISHYTEANLIKKLEEIGIGRPSTYAHIIETLKERGYVKREDIEGESVEVANFILQGCGKIEEKREQKKLGAEKNKLILQPVGEIVCRFLTTNFADFFEYDYTRKMEDSLDKIANLKGESEKSTLHQKEPIQNNWYMICEEVLTKILQNIGNLKIEKQQFKLTDTTDYVIIYGKYGPVIKGTKNDNEFIPIKRNLLKNFVPSSLKYSLEELRELPNTKSHTPPSDNPNILRTITEDLSIRRGKTGPYIFYKTAKMIKPQFYSLRTPKTATPAIDHIQCSTDEVIEWIRKMYNIPI